MPDEPKAYKYFAFISYSRKDSEPAAWLQKRLEWFRFPVKLVAQERLPPDPQFIRPIYRDKTNLEATDEHYWKNIRLALEQSRYLIVLCSPNSAASQPVEMEVSHFLASHDNQSSLVVPMIVSGHVSSTGNDAALCPTLRFLGPKITSRHLPSLVPDSATEGQDAWEEGFVTLVAYLLQLNRRDIGDHIQREMLRQARERARDLRRWLVAVGALGLLVILGAVLAWNQKGRAEKQEAIAKQERTQAVNEKQKAETQASIARQTTAFVRGMFNEIDPAKSKGRDITVREVLDKAAANTGKSFQGNPAVEYEVRDTLGHIYSAIGKEKEALAQSEAMLRLARINHREADHAEIANSMNNVAYGLKALGLYKEALPKFKAALEMNQRLHDGDHEDVATAINNVASCFKAMGLHNEALPKFQAALEMRQRLFKGDHEDKVTGLHNLASCLGSLERHSEALPLDKAAVEMSKRLFMGDRPVVALTLNGLASRLSALDSNEEALQTGREALEMRQRLFKDDHEDVANSLQNVAGYLLKLGREDEGRKMTQQAAEMMQRIYPGDHPYVADALQGAASLASTEKAQTNTLSQFEEALRMRQRLTEGDDPNVAYLLHSVASCLRDLGRYNEALPKYQAALEMSQRLHKGDHLDVVHSLRGLGLCLVAMNRPEEALVQLQAALKMTQALFKGNHPLVAESLRSVATSLHHLGRDSEALPLCKALLEMRKQMLPADHDDVIASYRNLASSQDALNQSAEAQESFQAAQDLMNGKGLEDVVVVQRITSNSPAEKLGLKPGDVLLKQDDRSIFSVSQLINLRKRSQGRKASLTIEREGKTLKWTVQGSLQGVEIKQITRPLLRPVGSAATHK